MNIVLPKRLRWLLWLVALLLLVSIWLYPPSTFLTRLSGIVLLLVVWIGLMVLTWPSRVFRLVVVGVTAVCIVVLCLPARAHHDPAALRSDYVASLRRYQGVTYYWGGESPKGIDCSGLIRRGLVDSMFLEGIRSCDPGLVRYAAWLWWHDCTAYDLGEGHGVITHLFETPSINALDHSKLLPGDLGVTHSAFIEKKLRGRSGCCSGHHYIGPVQRKRVVSRTDENREVEYPGTVIECTPPNGGES